MNEIKETKPKVVYDKHYYAERYKDPEYRARHNRSQAKSRMKRKIVHLEERIVMYREQIIGLKTDLENFVL